MDYVNQVFINKLNERAKDNNSKNKIKINEN